jgi:hypothetical protein
LDERDYPEVREQAEKKQEEDEVQAIESVKLERVVAAKLLVFC